MTLAGSHGKIFKKNRRRIMEELATLLHLTDLHLFADPTHTMMKVNPAQTLGNLIDLVAKDSALKPDLAVLTGDLSQDSSAESYELGRQIIQALGCPILATMGNHDHLQNFSRVFPPFAQQLETLPMKLEPWRILLLNSYYPQHVEGKLADEEIDFLKYNLNKYREAPTLIFLHHHILPSTSDWLNNIGLLNSQLFLDIIAPCQNIKAVICGHVHQETSSFFGTIPFFSTPATSWQFATQSEKFKLDRLMPGCRWIKLFANGSMTSGILRLPHNDLFIPDQCSRGY
jgi:Icc protein